MTSTSIPRALLLVALSAALPVHAQSLSPAWTEYREGASSDAPATAPVGTRDTAPTPAAAASSQPAHPQAVGAPAAHGAQSAYATLHSDSSRGAFFVAAQAGQAWIVDDVRQDTKAISAGYRWQAGPAVQVGIEGVAGRIEGTAFNQGWGSYYIEDADYASLGANARFQLGSSPMFAMTRVGYWRADAGDGDTVDGGYAGVGLGVDFSRHVNLTLAYTLHAYATRYGNGTYDFDVSRADLVTLGLEARF